MSQTNSGQKTKLSQWTGDDALQHQDDTSYFPHHSWYDTTSCVRALTHDEKLHGIDHDWNTLESAVRPIRGLDAIVDGLVIVEEQHEQTTRVIDDTGKETVMRATADGHDYSDMGGKDDGTV